MTAEPPPADAGASDTRSLILDATEQIMLEEGYAGVSSRKVAARAGQKSKLLHYHFRTMDALFIATFQRREERHLRAFAAAVASGQPLHDLWTLSIDAASSRLYLEFNALACHRPAVREVIARSNRRERQAVATAIAAVFGERGIDAERLPPMVLATAIAGMARVFATDHALGTDDGHAPSRAFIGGLLDMLEPGGGPEAP